MDYNIYLSVIDKLSNDLNDAKETIKDLYNEYESSYINSLTGSVIGSKCSAVQSSIKRINNGVNNAYSWISDYHSELVALEANLANFKGSSVSTPLDFLGNFTNPYAKATIPTLKTGATEEEKVAQLMVGEPYEDYIPQNGSNNRVPYFSQNDGTWSGLGFGDGSISSGGCSISSIAMVMSYTKKTKITPADIRQTIMDNNGGSYTPFHIPGVGASWSIFKNVGNYYGVNCNELSSQSVAQSLQSGNPVIMSTSSQPFTSSGHFIVLTGITPDGKVTINDPNGSHADYSYRDWNLNDVVNKGKGFWSYSL